MRGSRSTDPGRSVRDTLFVGGCTAIFLVMMASVAGAVSLYLG